MGLKNDDLKVNIVAMHFNFVHGDKLVCVITIFYIVPSFCVCLRVIFRQNSFLRIANIISCYEVIEKRLIENPQIEA